MINGIKCFYDEDELDGLEPIKEGCARAMGFKKWGIKEKRQLIRRTDILVDRTTISENVSGGNLAEEAAIKSS